MTTDPTSGACWLKLAIVLLCLAVTSGHADAQEPSIYGGRSDAPKTINDELSRFVSAVGEVEIAPMTKQGDPTPGTYTAVKDRHAIFDAIFARAGIEPCKTNPADLRGHEGFLEYVKKDNSQVLNPGGTRSTFGYFIKARTVANGEDYGNIEYFVLFSYDTITRKGKDGKDEVICATELFLFSPEHFGRESIRTGGAYLVNGYAIASDGHLLSEVPVDLAQVSNFPGEEKRKGEPVKVGTGEAGKGCLVCHEKNSDSYPQSTTPFPWVKPVKSPATSGEQPKTGSTTTTPTGEKPKAAATSPPSSAPPSGATTPGVGTPSTGSGASTENGPPPGSGSPPSDQGSSMGPGPVLPGGFGFGFGFGLGGGRGGGDDRGDSGSRGR